MIAACALVMGALVGIVMPIGDAGIATAQATVQDHAPTGTVPADVPPTSETPEGESITPADPPVPQITPEQPSQPNELKQPAPRAQAAPLAGPSGPALTWTVTDPSGNPLAGATVTVQGPATRLSSSSVSWGASYTVTDCVGTCGQNSMDQDPRPGVFAVDRLVTGTRVSYLNDTQRYRLMPQTTPAGHRWKSRATLEIPKRAGSQPQLPAASAWVNGNYDFGVLALEKAPLECVAGNVYSVSPAGQLQRVETGSVAGIVSNVGDEFGSGSFNGLGVGSGGNAVYAFNRSDSNRVYAFDTEAGVWNATSATIDTSGTVVPSNWLVGGAVDPSGRYWAGGFNTEGTRFQLWAMNDAGTRMQTSGQLKIPGAALGSNQGANGDVAFDTLGNLYLVRGVGTQLKVYRVDAANIKPGSGVATIDVAQPTVFEGTSPFSDVNGIAYDSDGKLFVGAGGKLAYLTRDANGVSKPSNALSLSGDSFATQDLASCSFPPTVRLQKNLPDGRAFAGDQFALELKIGATSLGKAVTTGSAFNVQDSVLGPIPVGVGAELTLSEAPANAGTKLENYSVSWECSLGNTVLWSEKKSQGKFTMPPEAAGKEILCTFTNKLMKVTKTADPASGTPVNENGVVNYTLTFDNGDGKSAVRVDYRDYLADVLDDATFYNPQTQQRSNTPFVTHKNGVTSEWVAAKQWLNVGGTVAAGATATLSFPVQVLPNAAQTGDREASETPQGFFLRNKLARGSSETPPATCEPGLCVEHPINAWSVEKASKPTSGARLHKGGNVHYSVTATKANVETTLNGLVLEDDLTHVFKSAGWAPDAAVPGGAKGRGVYLFDSEGFTLALDGRRNTGDKNKLQAVQAVSEPTQRNIATQGAPADMRWIVTSGAPINLPKEAVRAEMWFAVVVAESPVGIPDASIWKGQGNAPASGWHFANYATGIATKQQGSQLGVFAPNECVTGVDVPNTSAAPNAAQPVDVSFPQSCRTQHEVSENYFTIRKDAAGAGVQHLADDAAWDPDPTGLWNMVGHEFEIRDTDRATGKATAYPSAKLCRTDYAPDAGWDGTWATPAAAADASRWAFGAEGAAIQQKIVERNNAFPEAKPLPMCGTLYEIESGNQKGRWRSENLSAGDYWLVETKAPNAQSAENATSKAPRPVSGVQRLAQPVPFKIWPEADGPSGEGPEMQGRGQLDVGNGSGGYLDRCNPGQQDPETGEFLPGGTVAERPTACVNPTGYLMLVKDPAPVPLPLTGGLGPWVLWGGGGLALLIASVGIFWWRKRRPDVPRHAA